MLEGSICANSSRGHKIISDKDVRSKWDVWQDVTLFFLCLAGRKTGKGFYVYQEGVKNRSVNSGMDEVLAQFQVPANPEV